MEGNDEKKSPIDEMALLHYVLKEAALNKSVAKSTTTNAKSSVVTEPPIELYGYSLFFLHKDNFFRKGCYILQKNVWFGRVIIALIGISTVALALQTPLDAPES